MYIRSQIVLLYEKLLNLSVCVRCDSKTAMVSVQLNVR